MALLRSTDKLVEGSGNLFFSAQRAQDALSSSISSLTSQINAEVSNRQTAVSNEASIRQAADSALSGRLDVVEGSGVGSIAKALVDAKAYADNAVSVEQSARQSAVSAEQSRAQSAESALGGRLTVIEGSGVGSIAKSLVDAKAYADQKVADLVNGAPGMLDTLKEIADQLASDESVVGALTNTVASNLQTAKDYADNKVGIEKSRAEGAESALSGRVSSLEADPTTKTYVDGKVTMLGGQISQEVSDRQSAVSSEASARQSADSALSGRVSSLESDATSKTYVDGKVSMLHGEISQEISDRQSAVSSEQTRAQGAESALSGRIGVLEQDPTTKAYVDGQISTEQSARQSAVNTERSRAEGAESALSGRISSLEADPVTKSYTDSQVSAEQSARQSADSALSGRISVLETDPTTKAYVDGKVSMLQGEISTEQSARQSAVSSEASARQSADNALSGRLAVIEGSGAGSVAKSLVDAKAYADQKVSDLIGGAPAMLDTLKEIADQLANDESAVSALTSTVAANLQTAKNYADAAVLVETNARVSAVSAEQSRAQGVEAGFASRLGVLEGSGAGSVAKALVDAKAYADGLNSAEVSARQSADTTLQSNITGLFGTKTTSDLAEGSRLYYTQARFDSAFTGKSTTNLSEGTNLYYTQARFDSAFGGKSTSNLTEGSNLYYTTARAQADAAKRDLSNLTSPVALNQSLLFGTDGVGDIGGNGVNRPNNVYVKGTVTTGILVATNGITMSGGQSVKRAAKSANYTMTASDYLIGVTDTSAARTITLPSSGIPTGAVFIVKDESGAASPTNYISIAPAGGKTIDGGSDYKITAPYEAVFMYYNGSNWNLM